MKNVVSNVKKVGLDLPIYMQNLWYYILMHKKHVCVCVCVCVCVMAQNVQTDLKRKHPLGNNLNSISAKVVILVCDIGMTVSKSQQLWPAICILNTDGHVGLDRYFLLYVNRL